MNNNSIQIDRYLQNEMSAEEKRAFENQLATDKGLQEELNMQQQIIKAAETAGLKNEFAKAIRKRMVTRRLLCWGLVAVIAAVAFYFYAQKNNLFSHDMMDGEKKTVVGLPSPEKFDINTAADTIIETKDGVVFAIPAGAFSTNSNTIQLEIKTALNPLDIMRYGLSTMSNESLLKTAGMFAVNAFENGNQLAMNKEISVNVPAREVNPAMQLFDGVEDSIGRINWVNPKPIEKRLRTYAIDQLDFYPPNYIPTLKALGKDYKNKKYTDSLYYSFSGYPHSQHLPGTAEAAEFINDYPMADSTKEASIQPDSAVDRYYNYVNQIDPAKIRAIWNNQFKNTLIATKEFQERLQYMHSMCDETIGMYVDNINKPMFKIDELIAAKITNGPAKQKFLEFAKRKDGSVLLADGLQKKLSNYFYERSKAYREAVEKTWAKYQDSLNKLNNIADAKRREKAISDFKCSDKNFQEELCINLTNAYRQIGVMKTCNDTIVPPAANYYNVTSSTPGWKNLDVYATDATQNRQGMVYTDPATGKTATLTYKEVNITIANRKDYDRVLVYLIPDSLSSFQRIKEQGKNFKENLNSLFKYDAVVLAYKDGQAFFFRQQSLQPTNYLFSLTPVTAQDVLEALKNYSLIKANDIITDFEYQLFDQKEVERQLQLRKDQAFREKIAAAIYSCGEGTLILNNTAK